MFVAEYEANVLTPREADRIEMRHATEKEDLYMLQARYNQQTVVFDATYRSQSIGRLINHSKQKANIILRPPIEVRGKLRIDFIARRKIKAGEELLFDYDLKSYSKVDLPVWYTRGRRVSGSSGIQPPGDCQNNQATDKASQPPEDGHDKQTSEVSLLPESGQKQPSNEHAQSPQNSKDRPPLPGDNQTIDKAPQPPDSGQQTTGEVPQLPDDTLQPPKKQKAVYKRCKVPGCGATVKKMWNHIYGSRHKNLTGSNYNYSVYWCFTTLSF